MLTIEADQGPLLLKLTPTKAHFRSGTAVGRCSAALEDHDGESIEIHTVLLGFAGRSERLAPESHIYICRKHLPHDRYQRKATEVYSGHL